MPQVDSLSGSLFNQIPQMQVQPAAFPLRGN
jgi:hypothetical protein